MESTQWVWNGENNIESCYDNVSENTCINKEDEIKCSQFIYEDIGITNTMIFLAAVRPSYIYHYLKETITAKTNKILSPLL